MIPCLYDKTATVFSSLGKGMLRSCTSAIVTEEVNGIFELELEIAKADPLYGEIEEGSIITAIPSPYRGPEPFRVYKIEKAIAGVSTVYAHHISYDLAAIPVKPFMASSAAAAMQGLSDNAMTDCPFTFLTTKSTTANFNLEIPQAIRTTLGGVEGSILDTYRGEYVFEGLTVTLKQNRGSNRGFQVRYRKNLVGLTAEEDFSGVVDGILPFWTDEEQGTVYGSIQWKTGKSSGRVVTHDYSDAYEEKPTAAQLNARAALLVNSSGYGEPDLSIEVDFINLEQMSGGASLTQLERCDLGDTVTVIAEPVGVTKTAEVVAIETNVLLEKYNKVTIGTVRADIAQTIVENQKAAETGIKNTKNFLVSALEAATALITGATGGNIKYLYNDATGLPSAILAMDTDDTATAQNVLILNYRGFGLSTNGINGPFDYALTAENGLNASLIKVGILQGIRAILESGSVGGWEIASRYMYKDVETSSGDKYRFFLQPPDGVQNVWMISGQMYNPDTGKYEGIWHINADGSAYLPEITSELMVDQKLTAGGAFEAIGAATFDSRATFKNGLDVTGGNMTVSNGLAANQIFCNNTLWFRWGGQDTGRIAMTSGDYMYFGGTDVNRWVCLGQESSHWGFFPWSDTYLDLGLSGKRWDNVYAQTGTIQTSDKRQKKSIKALGRKALEFLGNLRPVSYLMKKGTSGRRHWGLIAQDVEMAMALSEMNSMDFAGIIKDEEGRYGLRYEEFIAPLILAVQDLTKRVEALEGKNGNG